MPTATQARTSRKRCNNGERARVVVMQSDFTTKLETLQATESSEVKRTHRETYSSSAHGCLGVLFFLCVLLCFKACFEVDEWMSSSLPKCHSGYFRSLTAGR